MPQLSWSVTGHTGHIYRLGLFHGDDTRHVVVHCNDKVVAIDFDVKESKTYSVFLDQELCEVSIDHTGGTNFDYDCRINHEVATPLNQQRNKIREAEERADRLRVYALAAVLIVAVLIWLF